MCFLHLAQKVKIKIKILINGDKNGIKDWMIFKNKFVKEMFRNQARIMKKLKQMRFKGF